MPRIGTPDHLRHCRQTLGLRLVEWAQALGYRSEKRERLREQIDSMETGARPITQQTARLAEMFARYGVPADFAGDPADRRDAEHG